MAGAVTRRGCVWLALGALAAVAGGVPTDDPDGTGLVRAQSRPVPRVESHAVRGGTLVVLRNPGAFGAAALIGGEVLLARGPAVDAYDLQTRQGRPLFELPPRSGLVGEVTGLLPFVNGEAVVAVGAYRDPRGRLVDYDVVMHDARRGLVERLYRRSAESVDFRLDVLDWTLRNQIFLYEYRAGGVGRWLGEIVRVTVFPRAVENLSTRHGIRGVPSAEPDGARLVVVAGPDETLGQPYHLELLDLDTDERRTILERFGTRLVVFDGQPTMTATRARWTADGAAVVFADTEHAVDAAPTVTHVALNTAADRREQSVSDAGEALNLLVTDAGTAVVLYRRTTDAQIVVEETRLDRPTSRVVLTSDDPVALLGIVPR